ncbi:MAG: helix-turn-helix domain-containing protein [Candidatus Woesearchaeota archaeon]
MDNEEISFGCSIFSNEKVLSCSFGLTQNELEMLKLIIRKDEILFVKEISELLNKNRTTIQKTLKNLLEKDFIKRKQINRDKGFAYGYFPLKKHEYITLFNKKLKGIKESIHDQINQWYE